MIPLIKTLRLLSCATLLAAIMHPANTFSQDSSFENNPQDIPAPMLLSSKMAIKRELAGGEKHPYQLTIDRGQYIQVKVEQDGIDVVLLFNGPEDRELLQIDTPNGATGYESLDFVAINAGTYQLTIVALDKNAKTGHYRVHLTESRKAQPGDAVKVAQQQALIAAAEIEKRASEMLAKGEAQAAETLLQEAIQLRGKVPGESYVSHPLGLLAASYEAQKKNELAFTTYERLLSYLERKDRKSASVGFIVFRIGALHLSQNDFAKAEPRLIRALNILERKADVSAEHLMVVHQTLVNLYKLEKQFAKAAVHQLRALELVGSENAQSAVLLTELADMYLEQRELLRAIDALQKALATCDKLKLNPEITNNVLMSLASAYSMQALLARHQSNFELAEKAGLEALALVKRLATENKEYETEILKVRALFLNQLGETYLTRDDGQKDQTLADQALREALSICEKMGPEFSVTASVLRNLGHLLYKRNHYGEAESLLRRAIDLQRTVGSDSSELFKAQHVLGQLYLDRQNLTQAEPLLLEAYRLAAEKPYELAQAGKHLGKLYQATGDFGRAESYLQQASTFYRKMGSESFEVAIAYLDLGDMYTAKGDFRLAESFLSRAVAIHRKRLSSSKGSGFAPILLGSLRELAVFYIATGNYERAQPIIREVRTLGEQAGSSQQSLVHLSIIGGSYFLRGRFAEAEKLAEEALLYVEPESLEAAMILLQLGSISTSRAQYPRAESFLKKAVAIFETRDNKAFTLVHALNFLAELYRQQGRYSEALSHTERILGLYEKEFGPEHVEVAKHLRFVAIIYLSRNDYPHAERLLLRSLGILEKQLGTESLEVAETLNSLCMLYGLKGDILGLQRWRERALNILQKHPETKTFDSVTTLVGLYLFGFKEKELKVLVRSFEESFTGAERQGEVFILKPLKRVLLGQVYGLLGDFARAEQYYKDGLKMTEEMYGRVSPNVVQALEWTADFYASMADYSKAETYYVEALKIQNQLFDRAHPAHATLLMKMGDLQRNKGDYTAPEDYYLKALEIRTALFGLAGNSVIETQSKLADLYRDRGEYDRAERLYKTTLASAEELIGANSLPAFNLYFGLGTLYRHKEAYDLAEVFLKKAQDVVEKIYGKATLLSWGALIIPARIHLQQGDYIKAQILFNQALELRKKVGAPSDLSESFLYLNLAETYRLQGAFADAIRLATEALEMREKFLGPEHPDTIMALEALADTRLTEKDLREAVRLRTLAAERAERSIAKFLTSGSERQKSQFLVTFNKSTDAIVSLHLQNAPANTEAKSLALTTILRRKGRALDVFSDQLTSLRRRARPEDLVILDELAAANSRWTNLVFQIAAQAEQPTKAGTPPGFIKEMRELETKIQQLEATLSRHSAEFKNQIQFVTIDAVKRAIPSESALVEFIAYRPYNPGGIGYKNRFGPTRYAAYILTSDSKEPEFVDLGEAQPIDVKAVEWRSLLGKEADEKDIKQAGHALYLKLFAPLMQYLQGRKRILLAPDGNLNFIQFAALVDEQDRYLVEDYELSYLTSGRELLRMQESFSSESVATVVADPMFDLTQPNPVCPPGIVDDKPFNFTQRCYKRLPGTAQEAIEIKDRLSGVQVWTDTQATEGNLKSVRQPRTLHMATHGFFWPDLTSTPLVNEMALGLGETTVHGEQRINPMVRSGLILAGVKQAQSGAGENGVLTAQEIASLNLLGTKLVVLSACETGLGDVQNGQGIYGLRRALVLAGSETQIISLWKVSDRATQTLMASYYKRLQAGEGRIAAMRAVQLEMLRGTVSAVAKKDGTRDTSDVGEKFGLNYRHPFYWAAFIASGDWRNMNKK